MKNLIRKYKISEIIHINFTVEENNFLNTIRNNIFDLIPFKSNNDKYINHIFYMNKKDKWVFTIYNGDKKYLYYNYNYFGKLTELYFIDDVNIDIYNVIEKFLLLFISKFYKENNFTYIECEYDNTAKNGIEKIYKNEKISTH